MYQTILVTLDTTATDRAIIEHIKPLAKAMHSRLVLLHVATGVPAQLHGPNAAGEEIGEDRAYLRKVQAEFDADGVPAKTELAYGDPVREIVKWIHHNACDLVAMSTHGHQFIADLLLGNTASRVQHQIKIPVLLLKAN
jgi:nucleotide-binding universal stress UspA family protein